MKKLLYFINNIMQYYSYKIKVIFKANLFQKIFLYFKPLIR